ncbi:hypothetical protein D3C71_2100800 [compost metagenome]
MVLHRHRVDEHRFICAIDLLNNIISYLVIGDEITFVLRIAKLILTHKAFKSHLLINILTVPEPAFIRMNSHAFVALLFKISSKTR